MTLPANIRINLGAPFPATVKGAGAVAIAKTNGIWTVSLNYSGYAQSLNVPNPATTNILAQDTLTGMFYAIAVPAISGIKTIKILNGAGAFTSPYAALPGDDVLIVKQGAAAAFTITVDWSLRTKPLRIVAGDTVANFANITITPAAGQTQMATVNYSYVIDSSGGSIILTPLPDNTGAY